MNYKKELLELSEELKYLENNFTFERNDFDYTPSPDMYINFWIEFRERAWDVRKELKRLFLLAISELMEHTELSCVYHINIYTKDKLKRKGVDYLVKDINHTIDVSEYPYYLTLKCPSGESYINLTVL